jgi:hypothetical protein
MIPAFNDPFAALFSLQKALVARLASDWLEDATTSRGPFPPINVFQQGDDILAINPAFAARASCSPTAAGSKKNVPASSAAGSLMPGIKVNFIDIAFPPSSSRSIGTRD